MLPWRPCFSTLRRRDPAASLARSDAGLSPSVAFGPLLLRPAGGTGGKSRFDIPVSLLKSEGGCIGEGIGGPVTNVGRDPDMAHRLPRLIFNVANANSLRN